MSRIIKAGMGDAGFATQHSTHCFGKLRITHLLRADRVNRPDNRIIDEYIIDNAGQLIPADPG